MVGTSTMPYNTIKAGNRLQPSPKHYEHLSQPTLGVIWPLNVSLVSSSVV